MIVLHSSIIGSAFMKRFFLGIFAFILLAIVGLVTVAMLMPKEAYKVRIEAAAAEALGREVLLNGDVGLSFFPRISANVEDVLVANPEGFTSPYMIKAGALRGSVKWGPLLTGRVEIKELAFVDANVDLEVLADGRANWEFSTKDIAPAAKTEPTGEINAGIDRARLINAALTYRDGSAGQTYTLTDLNLEAALTSLTETLLANGKGVFEGDAFSFDLKLDSPQAVIDGTQAIIDLTFSMDVIKATYSGTAALGEVPSVEGNFSANIPDLQALSDYAKIDPETLPVRLSPLGRAEASGKVSGALDALALRFSRLSIEGSAIDLTYIGAAVLTETPSLDGNVDFELRNAAATIKSLGLDIPEAGVLERANLSLSSKVSGPANALNATAIDLMLEGPLLAAAYTGSAAIGPQTSVDGRLTLNAQDVHALVLASKIALEVTQTDPLKGASLRLAADLKGPAEAISASGIDLSVVGPLLNASYTGDVSLAGKGTVNGQLSASSQRLRALMAAAQIELEPGDTLQTFRISGAAAGAFDRLAMKNIDLAIDEITGKGDLMVRTDTPRLSISGNLATGPLDLTAFMGETPENQPKGWSKEPLALDSLKSLDADIILTSPSIIIDTITIKEAILKTKLANGVLDANIEQFKVFGGLWKGGIDLDTSKSTPTLKIAMTGDSILMQEIMRTFVGNEALTGGGQFKLDVDTSGNSLDVIMKNLNGELSANLADGALKGVNIGQLIRSASDLRSSLSSGAGLSLGLSPGAQSDFSRFNSVLQIRNGVANIEIMEMISSTFGANGLGQINLGGQTLDMALRIAADKTGRGDLKDVQLNNVGIPLRITGDWTAPRIVPDTSVLSQMLAGKALDRVGNLLGTATGSTNTKDAVSDVLSGVLGNRQQSNSPVPAPAGAPSGNSSQPAAQDEKKKPETVEETVEDIAKEALGGLFGRRKKDE